MNSEKRERIAVIEYKKCSPEKCGFLCARICPINRTGKECITEEKNHPRISENLCTGCGICVNKCPFNAISIINLSAKLEKKVHCYGKNQFRLYGLPSPAKSTVVGLIGRNGIGKTTAIKILSGRMIPKPACEGVENHDAVIEIFKGKELQAYFENLKNAGIKTSSKPQDIGAIQKKFNGKVRKLLEEFDEQEKLKEITEKLGVERLLESKITQLSGGEMQKIAVAACMLKKADFYFFDEPSSYLDVQERLVIAKAIREIAESGKYVMVVEHDLAVLDYLSDLVHVLFGAKNAYGAVSSRMSVLNGINQYLEGYLKNENIKFREKEIIFPKSAAETSGKKTGLLSYPAFTKTYPKFTLETKQGEIRKGEILGILGPNAIGKTTFVKILAGIEKSDNGKINLKQRLAFKPQYLTANKTSVMELIETSKINKELFESEANKRFKLNELRERKLIELSGGELQKVAIALTMCRKADLYLLDEPSAFLDVEERLNAASLIRTIVEKTGKSCIIVEHDLLFQDYLCDRLIVFEGIPGKKGNALKAEEKENAMNRFLKALDITFRRDHSTGRPRANKQGSVKDTEQKKENRYYYH